MIVDPSAIVAIILGEPGSDAILNAIVNDPAPQMSAASYVELCLVLDRRTSVAGASRLDALLAAAGIEVVSFTPEQARIARRAHAAYGRGTGHPARLNLGDCFSYALATDADEQLLFKGDDFVHTDVIAVRT